MQTKGERGYHVFYQLLRAPHSAFGEEMRAQMMLRAPEEYQYLMNSGCTSVAGVDDEKARSRTPGPAGHARRAVGIRMSARILG